MKKPRFGGDGRSSREEAEREAQAELDRLTRGAGPRPPSAPSGRSSYSPPAPRSYAPPPAASRSPGFGGPVHGGDDEEYEEEYEDEEDGDVHEGPRSAREEEELVTELALRDWASTSGRSGRMEDYARPRLDPTSVEAQRDRALREIMERQERLQKQYRDQKSGRQPIDASTDVSDIRAAHQMNVLRRGKPPGMMNMAAAQTGALNRQRSERMSAMAARNAAAAEALSGPDTDERRPTAGKKASTARKAAPKAAGRKASTPAKASRATRSPAPEKAPAAKKAGRASAAKRATAAPPTPAAKATRAAKAAPATSGARAKAAKGATRAAPAKAAKAAKPAKAAKRATEAPPATAPAAKPAGRAGRAAKGAKASRAEPQGRPAKAPKTPRRP